MGWPDDRRNPGFADYFQFALPCSRIERESENLRENLREY
jgi:hypothetical protein